MDRFSKLHPIVLLFYYLAVLVIVLSAGHPVFSGICLAGAILYCMKIKGSSALSSLKFVFFLLIFVSLFNMLFAHYGENVLFKIKDTAFTLEALFYGFNQGLVLSAVILWFDAFSHCFDSEKVICVFRFTPKFALIFSMVLGFIPRFTKKLSDIRDAQLGLCGGEQPKNLKERILQSRDNLSALITYSLESSIITSDAMDARGYNPRAVRKSRFRFTLTDAVVLTLLTGLAAAVFIIKTRGGISFIFQPAVSFENLSLTALLCFTVLELMPVSIDLLEEARWKLSSAKM